MLFDVVDTLQQKRRPLFIAVFAILCFWGFLACNQVLQTHRSDMTVRIRQQEHIQTQLAYRSEAINGDITASVSHTLDSLEINLLRTTITATDNITKAEQTARAGIAAAFRAIVTAIGTSVRFIGMVFMTTLHLVKNACMFAWRAITHPFIMVGKGVHLASQSISGVTSGGFASVIQPPNKMDVPVITPEQAHQVSIIQEDTLAVEPVKPVGSGGACDNGAGNGGYPMEWCDARMDTIRTVAYSNDRINRQCTSYAYWYFTTIEGHSDFRVSGNANRWARTSNYPTHTTPAVGAIAVETRGYYGHVAIVQALPGQTHDGKVVPEGYILVSEMNYDWQGHFRYSYSPISKFSAYIYP